MPIFELSMGYRSIIYQIILAKNNVSSPPSQVLNDVIKYAKKTLVFSNIFTAIWQLKIRARVPKKAAKTGKRYEKDALEARVVSPFTAKIGPLP
jgi:hypothetical protein